MSIFSLISGAVSVIAAPWSTRAKSASNHHSGYSRPNSPRTTFANRSSETVSAQRPYAAGDAARDIAEFIKTAYARRLTFDEYRTRDSPINLQGKTALKIHGFGGKEKEEVIKDIYNNNQITISRRRYRVSLDSIKRIIEQTTFEDIKNYAIAGDFSNKTPEQRSRTESLLHQRLGF